MSRDDADLTKMFRAQGEPITLDPASTYGIVTISGADAPQGQGPRGVVRRLEIDLKTGSLAGLVVGSIVGVRSESWRVLEVDPTAESGGDITHIKCSRVVA